MRLWRPRYDNLKQAAPPSSRGWRLFAKGVAEVTLHPSFSSSAQANCQDALNTTPEETTSGDLALQRAALWFAPVEGTVEQALELRSRRKAISEILQDARQGPGELQSEDEGSLREEQDKVDTQQPESKMEIETETETPGENPCGPSPITVGGQDRNLTIRDWTIDCQTASSISPTLQEKPRCHSLPAFTRKYKPPTSTDPCAVAASLVKRWRAEDALERPYHRSLFQRATPVYSSGLPPAPAECPSGEGSRGALRGDPGGEVRGGLSLYYLWTRDGNNDRLIFCADDALPNGRPIPEDSREKIVGAEAEANSLAAVVQGVTEPFSFIWAPGESAELAQQTHHGRAHLVTAIGASLFLREFNIPAIVNFARSALPDDLSKFAPKRFSVTEGRSAVLINIPSLVAFTSITLSSLSFQELMRYTSEVMSFNPLQKIADHFTLRVDRTTLKKEWVEGGAGALATIPGARLDLSELSSPRPIVLPTTGVKKVLALPHLRTLPQPAASFPHF